MNQISSPSLAVRLSGTEEAEAQVRVLRAGALSAELDGGALRAIRLGGVEVIRAIAFLVRDENWGTFSPAVAELKVSETADSFTVAYRGTCEDARRKLVYEAVITGSSDGSLGFEVTALPMTNVLTQRTGFVVLHPLVGVAGQPVKVLHIDGREETSTFPDRISPSQPFFDIRALSHQVTPGVWVTCTMTGDTFEMEDQRNWSDASYKTYVRPLSRPRPYTLNKGESFTQAVRLSVTGALPTASTTGTTRPVKVSLGGETGGKLPLIGIGVPAEEADHAVRHADLVKQLGPRFLVCRIDRRLGDGLSELTAYRRLAQAVNAEITLEIIIPGGMDPVAELKPVADDLRELDLRPSSIEVFPAQDLTSRQPDEAWPEMPGFEAIYAAARSVFPGVRLGGGMTAYFTELNRKRPPAGLLDFVTHTSCPIVHAADDRSVMETLEALPYIILSTRAFMGDIPYQIGPSTIGCRENPYGRTTAPNPDNRRVCLSRHDPRQHGLFNAAYTIGYAAACAKAGITALSMGAPTGPFGFIHHAGEGPQRYFETLADGAVYPAYHVMAGLAASSGAALVEVSSDCRNTVEALACRGGDGTVLWLANLTPDDQAVAFAGFAPERATIAMLDQANFEAAATKPGLLGQGTRPLGGSSLTLGGYGVARVDIS